MLINDLSFFFFDYKHWKLIELFFTDLRNKNEKQLIINDKNHALF